MLKRIMQRSPKFVQACWCLLWILLAADSPLRGQEYPPPGDESPQYQAEVVLDNLDHPAGLLLGKVEDGFEKTMVFFAESGVGSVRSFPLDSPQAVRSLITDFAVRPVGDLDQFQIGPWTLGFLTPSKLIVGGGIEPLAGVYSLAKESSGITAAEAEAWIGARIPEVSKTAGLPAMAIGEREAYFTAGRPGATVAVWQAKINANEVVELQEIVKVENTQGASFPVGMCLSPDQERQFLVTTTAGALPSADHRDSELRFYVPSSGRLGLRLKLGLWDAFGVAYSPSGQLYVVDLAGGTDQTGGVYRVDDARWQGKPACRVVKIAEAEHPTSLAFVDGQTLLVTTCGKEIGEKKGNVLRIRGEF